MNKEKMTIWGRAFELEIKYDCYTGEEIEDIQKEAVSSFLKSQKAVDGSLENVRDYCLKHHRAEIGSDVIENIFRYVAPKYLYVVRNPEKRIVAIMCNYKFDPEHGIAVVFENEKFSKIGQQDIVL